MLALVFPGQAAQFEGMGKDLYDEYPDARDLFDQANQVVGFDLADVMFHGTAEDLKQTRVTQPAVFLHSVISFKTKGKELTPEAVAGHSLGEFSALVAAGALTFEEGLQLVKQRAEAMQYACDQNPGTMAAIVGLDEEIIEQVCEEVNEEVVPANYNCPGQLVISGSLAGIEKAVQKLQEKDARRAIILQVGGAFHSPLMEPARERLETAIEAAEFQKPKCPVYQNVDAQPHTDPEKIKENLMKQLAAPVRWTQTMKNMISDGCNQFIEVGGNGKVIRGFLRRVSRDIETSSI